MTKSQIIHLDQNASAQADSTFHSCRLAFNSSFLNEQFELAFQHCRRAWEIPSLNVAERTELISWLQMLGKADEALQQLEAALGLEPGDHSLAIKKAEMLRLQDKTEACRSFLLNRLDLFPSVPGYYTQYLELAETLNNPNERDFIHELAAQNSVVLAPEIQGGALSVETGSPAAATVEYSDADLLSLLSLFQGRENCHARQWVSEDGKSGYTLVNEPLNINLLRNHLLGIHTLGVYQLDLSSKVKWIAFDLDLEKSHLDDLHDRDFRSWLDQGFQQVIANFRTVLKTYHLEPNVEFSGYKGYHIWILLEEKVSASFARGFAQRIAAQVSLENLPLKIEIFPKQSRVSSANYGNLVKLPYGVHKLSGLPSSMLAEDGSLIPVTDFVRAPRLVSASDFVSALYSLDPAFNAATDLIPSIEPEAAPAPAGEFTAAFDPETDPEWLCLRQHCSALWYLDNLAKTAGKLSQEQKNVLRFTCGYLKQGPAIVNSIMQKLTNCEAQDLMKSAFKGNAISCAKIRSYLAAELDPEKCDCDFSLDPGMYATPLLHLKRLESGQNTTVHYNELKLRELVDTYLRLKKDAQQLGVRLEQTERQIISAFDEIGVQELATPYGKLRKTLDQDTVHLILDLK